MAGLTVEFKGKDNVLQAYDMFTEQYNSPYFSIWCGKELRFAYSKDDDGAREYLEQVLTVLQQNGATGIYQMRFHGDLNKNGRIDNNSPHTGSFNFKATGSELMNQGGYNQPVNDASFLMMEMQKRWLQKMMDKMDEMDNMPEPGESVSGLADGSPEDIVMKIMDNPVAQRIAGMVLNGVENFFTKQRPMNNQYRSNGAGFRRQQEPAAPGGIAGVDVTDAAQSVAESIDRLYKIDPQLPDHLKMLADLAEDSPKIYMKAINKLRQLM